MAAGDYRSDAVTIRTMRDEDAAPADLVAFGVLGHYRPTTDEEARRRDAARRIRHCIATDPGGAFVAEMDGTVVGAAIALLREGLWGLGLLAVREDLQSRGIGRRLMDAVLAYGSGARAAIIMSSEDPKAMRRYARAGFSLLPGVAAAGALGRVDAPDVEEPPRAEAIARAAPISRAARGASHGDDLGILLDGGCRLLLLGDRAFVVHDERSIRVLAATGEVAAIAVMRAAFAALPPGATVQVDHLRAGQDWAIRTCLDAGLALSPAGPTFVRGDIGPLAHYIPSGAFL